MNEISVKHFCEHLEAEVDKIISEHETLRVKRRQGGDFVVISAEDWRSIEETLYLSQFPGLAESIHKAAQEPLSEGTRLESLDW